MANNPKMPWLAIYASDWLSGTRGLTLAHQGLYTALILMMAERGGPLTEDDDLARACGCKPSQFPGMIDKLVRRGLVTRTAAGLFSDHVAAELKKRIEKSRVGSAAASVRWQKDEQNQSSPDADAMPRARGPQPQPESQSELEPPPLEHVAAREEGEKAFEKLWAVFPHNPESPKDDARAAFLRIAPDDRDRVFEAAKRRQEGFSGRCGKNKRAAREQLGFEPYLATWLAKGRWRDEPVTGIAALSQGRMVNRHEEQPLFAACERARGFAAPAEEVETFFARDVVMRAGAALDAEHERVVAQLAPEAPDGDAGCRAANGDMQGATG